MRARPQKSSQPQRYPKFALCGLAMLVFAACLSAQEAEQPAAEKSLPAEQKFKHAAVIQFEGPITPWLQGCHERKLAAAQKAGADLIVVEIDSPGGLLHESTQ